MAKDVCASILVTQVTHSSWNATALLAAMWKDQFVWATFQLRDAQVAKTI